MRIVIILLFTFFLLVIRISSLGQPLTSQWAIHIGGTGDDTGIKVITDLDSNIYFTGIFMKQAYVSINGITDTIESRGLEDIYVGKVNDEGILQWSMSFGGKGSDSPTDLMIGQFGELYLSGVFQDTLVIFNDTLVCSDYVDSFIAKVDSLGGVLWIRQISGDGNQQCRSLIAGLNGALYSGGFYSKSLEFPGQDTSAFESLGGFDSFVSKWTEDGELEWVNNISNSGDVLIKDLMVNNQGNCFVVGNFTDSIFNESNQFKLKSMGKTDVFFLNYNEDGSLESNASFGGYFNDNAKCITTSGNNKLVLAGEFKEQVFYNGNSILEAEGGDDIFYITLKTNGDLHKQKKHGLEKNDFVFEAWIPVGQKILMASDLKINQDNQSVLLADYEIPGEMSDIYLSGFDYNPQVLSAVMLYPDQIYLCGNFHDAVDFDQINLVSHGHEDFYLVKLGSDLKYAEAIPPDSNTIFSSTLGDSSTISLNSYNISSSCKNDSSCNLRLYPNPFSYETNLIFQLFEKSDVQIKIFDAKGIIIKAWNSPNQSPGTYCQIIKDMQLKSGLYICNLTVSGATSSISENIVLIHVK